MPPMLHDIPWTILQGILAKRFLTCCPDGTTGRDLPVALGRLLPQRHPFRVTFCTARRFVKQTILIWSSMHLVGHCSPPLPWEALTILPSILGHKRSGDDCAIGAVLHRPCVGKKRKYNWSGTLSLRDKDPCIPVNFVSPWSRESVDRGIDRVRRMAARVVMSKARYRVPPTYIMWYQS